jgi:hypothetical protein
MFDLKVVKTENQVSKIGRRLGISEVRVKSLIKACFLLKSSLSFLENDPLFKSFEEEALRQLIIANKILYEMKDVFILMPVKYKIEIFKIEMLLLKFSFPKPLGQKRNRDKIKALILIIEKRILKYKVC